MYNMSSGKSAVDLSQQQLCYGSRPSDLYSEQTNKQELLIENIFFPLFQTKTMIKEFTNGVHSGYSSIIDCFKFYNYDMVSL